MAMRLSQLWTSARQRMFIILLVLLSSVAIGKTWFELAGNQTDAALPWGVGVTQGGLWVAQDFAYNLDYMKYVLRGELGQPFSLASVEEFVWLWTGSTELRGMPSPYTPVAWLVLWPLVHVPTSVLYCVWCAVPLLVLAGACWRTGLPFSWLVAAISGAMLSLWALGQTVLWGVLLAWLTLELSRRCERNLGWSGWWPLVLAALPLFLLAAKPSYALAVGAGLLAAGYWRVVMLAGVMTLLVVAGTCFFIGWQWIVDYVGMTGGEMPMAPLESMPNLTLVLTQAGVSAELARTIGAFVWLGGTLLVVGMGWLRNTSLLDVRYACALTIGAYLLACPHLTYTENVWLVLLMAWLPDDTGWRVRAIVLVLLAICLNTGSMWTPLAMGYAMALSWTAKLALLLLLWKDLRGFTPQK